MNTENHYRETKAAVQQIVDDIDALPDEQYPNEDLERKLNKAREEHRKAFKAYHASFIY